MAQPVTPVTHVALHKGRSIGSIIALAKAINAAMAANTTIFPSPNPSVVIFTSDITALDTAETNVRQKLPGAVPIRDEKLMIVVKDLDLLRAYVEQVANASPAQALSIVQAAGMSVRKTTTGTKTDLSVKPGKTSGSVDVVAKLATGGHAHEWQFSLDGGKTWSALPATLAAKTTLTGLAPGATVSVRHRAITKTGPDDWSQTVSAIVV
jgi:hypothetical protein